MAEVPTVQPSPEEQKTGGFFGKLKEALTKPIGAKAEEGVTEVAPANEEGAVAPAEVVTPEVAATPVEVVVPATAIAPEATPGATSEAVLGVPPASEVSGEVLPAPETNLEDAAAEITGTPDKLPGLGQEGVQPAAKVEEFRAEEAVVDQAKTDAEWQADEATQVQALKDAEAAFAQTDAAQMVEPVIGAETTPDGQPVEKINDLPAAETVQADMAPKVEAAVDQEAAEKAAAESAKVAAETTAAPAAELEKTPAIEAELEQPERNPADVAQVREIQINWLKPKIDAAIGQEKAALTALNGFLEAYSSGGYDDLADIKAQLAENGYQWIEETPLNDEQQRAADLEAPQGYLPGIRSAGAAKEVFDMEKFDRENPPELPAEIIDEKPVESAKGLSEAEMKIGQESLVEESEARSMFDRMFGPGMEIGTLTDAEKQEMLDEMMENMRKAAEAADKEYLKGVDEKLMEIAAKEAAMTATIKEAVAFLAELKEKEGQVA